MTSACQLCFDAPSHAGGDAPCECCCHTPVVRQTEPAQQPRGELHQLFADATDPQTSSTWLIEKLSKNSKFRNVLVVVIDEIGNGEWKLFGGTIHKGVLLLLVEHLRMWLLK